MTPSSGALASAHTLAARGRLKHPYPHSWRSKKPVIFRNTPQWFIAMDKPIRTPSGVQQGDSLRERALNAIQTTRWVPGSGENRIRGMIEVAARLGGQPPARLGRADRGLRSQGAPTNCWSMRGQSAHRRCVRTRRRRRLVRRSRGAAFSRPDYDPRDYEKVNDILDVWFDSGCTHVFTLEDPVHFPGGRHTARRGRPDRSCISRVPTSIAAGSSPRLLESCGTRGRAPFDIGPHPWFRPRREGPKMSKSIGNVIRPLDVIKESGADILRLWVSRPITPTICASARRS